MFQWWRNGYNKSPAQADDKRFDVRAATMCVVSGFICFMIFLVIRIEEENCDVGCINASETSERGWLICKDQCDKLELTEDYTMIGQVSCGNHDADSCKECPGQVGSSWCHGDCHWGGGVCMLHTRGIRDKCRRQCGDSLPDSSRIGDTEALCLKKCDSGRQKWAQLWALAAALIWSVATPLYARFPESCRCNCFVSSRGCTPTTIFSTLSWVTYIIACSMILLMAFISDSVFVIVYMVLALFSFLFMGIARFFYFQQLERLEMGLTTCSETAGASVIGHEDSPISPALVYELQAQVLDLSGKMRNLEKFVNMPSRGSLPDVELQRGFFPPKRGSGESPVE